MTAQAYTTKSGREQFRPVCSEEEMSSLMDDTIGFCLACGDEAYGVEPDARKYLCANCGAKKVYGLQELLMMDLVVIE